MLKENIRHQPIHLDIGNIGHNEGESKAEHAAVEQTNLEIQRTNREILRSVQALTKSDPRVGLVRLGAIIVVAIITVVGTFAVLQAVTQPSTDLGKTLVAGSVVVAALAYAGLTNPLQTLERDVVFRRWSDMIVNVYLVELAADDRPEVAGRAANLRFAALAASYSALASKSGDVLGGMAQAAIKLQAGGDDDSDHISIENPGPITVEAESSVAKTVISAKGPGKLAYSANLPEGLKIDPATGAILGTAPKEAKDYEVTVTVTSDKEGAGSAAVTFTLTVTAKPAKGDGDKGGGDKGGGSPNDNDKPEDGAGGTTSGGAGEAGATTTSGAPEGDGSAKTTGATPAGDASGTETGGAVAEGV